jgi:hypothetical protein
MSRTFFHRAPRRLCVFLAGSLSSLGAVSPILAAPQTLCPQHPLTPSASPTALFERGLASTGTRLAATFVDGQMADVELFERSGPTWISSGVLGAATPFNRNELFGHALDLEGASLLVAVPLAPGPVGNGVLRPFDRTPTGWVARPDIVTTHPFAQFFGDTFDRDGSVVVAHSWSTTFLTTENRLHVFEEAPSGAFNEVLVIDDPNPVPPGQGFSQFGMGLALNDTWLIAGGHRDPEGRVYAWQATPTGLVFTQELVPPGPRSETYGNAVAVSGNLIAVGDPESPEIPGVLGRGAVHVFEYLPATGTFVHLATLRVSVPFGTLQLGASVALEGRRLAATFLVATISSFPPSEGLAVFTDVGLPQQAESLVVQNPLAPNDAIGRTVRFADGEVVTTDRSTIVGNSQVPRGDLGRYTQGPIGLRVCRGAANSTGEAATLTIAPCVTQLGFTVSLAGLPPNEPGFVAIGVGSATLPVGQGVLCIGQPVRVARLVSSPAGTADALIDHVSAGFVAGDVVLVQAWYRDGAGMNLSEARELELAD